MLLMLLPTFASFPSIVYVVSTHRYCHLCSPATPLVHRHLHLKQSVSLLSSSQPPPTHLHPGRLNDSSLSTRFQPQRPLAPLPMVHSRAFLPHPEKEKKKKKKKKEPGTFSWLLRLLAAAIHSLRLRCSAPS
ncbi:uncharacterized protein BO97DRAFT_225393 [Aspergillus homomorphus CBS 101889]|uniref:Uncharacterized protein n=1 Tax=Aspergillus homomorphus (strain CBS 101889) TaxID=1450537 RepID=A0A395HJS4_ASPHC|nr:hypothetical protein BO97DRAFT_225393 [Aspergillus homomorphus CBS 101889]RAL08161.1 hypothetical protein BO97DRAFT_225393 [Aspergillus homomorphus CBS 101889]